MDKNEKDDAPAIAVSLEPVLAERDSQNYRDD